jgi:cysteine desulfuration protein SufE
MRVLFVLVRAAIVIALICLYSPLRGGGGGVWPSGASFPGSEAAKISDLAASSWNDLSDQAQRELARIAEREARNGIAKSLGHSRLRAPAPIPKAAGAFFGDARRPWSSVQPNGKDLVTGARRAYIIGGRVACAAMNLTIDEIVGNFELLDDWEERYRYLIDLGRMMPPLPEEAYVDANKVQGCASQVWLETWVDRVKGEPVLHLRGDSDAHIVRGLIALLVTLFSGKPLREVAATDVHGLFRDLGLTEHLTPQRSNGVRSMVDRIKRDARAAATPVS